VTRAYLPLLLTLGAIWGASFLFIEEADRSMEPTTIMAGRLLLAAAILVPLLTASIGLREAWSAMRRVALVGLISGIVNAALPFTLIAWGQKHIDSGTAAIANASMPIFVVLLAWRIRRSESARGSRLVGVLLGFVGVAVLAWANPHGGWWEVAGTLAVVCAAFCYAVGALYGQHHVSNVPVLVFSTAQCVAGTFVLLPFGLAQLPSEVPGWKAIGSVLALGIAATAIGTLMYFRLVAVHGSARASLVVYLLPPFALIYGSTLLGESLTAQKVIGLVLILGGVALGSGLFSWTRRPAPVPE
jgi:drug/metabolite transporter (DMT)-like permease